MNLTLTITASDPNELAVILGALGTKQAPPMGIKDDFFAASPQQVKVEPVADSPPAQVQTKAAAVTPTSTNTSNSNSNSTSTNTSTAAKPTTLTLEDLRAAFSAKLRAGKKAEIETILKSFSVEKISELPEEKYNEAHELIKAV